MFCCFNVKKFRKIFFGLLIVATSVLLCRYYILPNFLFPREYRQLVEAYSEKYDLEGTLIYSVIKTESGFDKNAVSPKSATGLMQISQTTAEWGASEIGIEDFTADMLFDPEINIEIGCWYIKKLILQYGGNINTALAAYNAGSGNVSGWLNNAEYSDDGENLKNIPFGETKDYVKKVSIYKKIYDILYN